MTWSDDLGFKHWQRQEIFLLSKNIRTSSGAHPASYSMGEEMRMITYLHLVLSLRMGGAIPPLLLHDFMVMCGENNFFFKQIIRGGTIKFCYVTSEHIARCTIYLCIYLIYHIFPSTQHTSLNLPLHVST